jgi:hypothetical protein
VGGGAEVFQQKSAVLDSHCAAIGRDPQTIQRSIQVLVYPEDLEETRNQVRSYAQAGATHLILSLRAPYPEGIVHRLDEEIIKPLRAEFEE